MKFQGIALRIFERWWCIKWSTSASFDGALRAPSNATGELPRWRSRHQNLHDNSQNDSLKLHAFSRFLPLFGVQKSCMGSLFFHPTIWPCLALKTYIKFWCGAPPGCEFFCFEISENIEKIFKFFWKKNIFSSNSAPRGIDATSSKSSN